MSPVEENSHQNSIVAKAMNALLVAQRLQRNKLSLGADYVNLDSQNADDEWFENGLTEADVPEESENQSSPITSEGIILTPQQQQTAIARIANLLQTQPDSAGIRVQYLTLVADRGTLEQQQTAIQQTATWLQSHVDAPAVWEKYLILVSRVGTTQQQQAAIVETLQWLASHPEDIYVREQYLVLVEIAGTTQQQQAAITQTSAWLQTHTEDRYVRQQYLYLVATVGTQQQQQQAVGDTTTWLRSHPQDQYVREQYLELINSEATKRINLRRLHQILNSLGDSFDNLLANTTEPRLAFRSSTGIWQERYLEQFTLDKQIIQLNIAIRLETDAKISVRLQLQPIDNNNYYLPETLQLILLSPSGDIIYQDQAGSNRELIEVIIPDGEPGDSFIAQIILGDTSIIKDIGV
ncbi:DUF1822 family protein [Calothrix sp. FACHB-1219]|uniref:DUF1822 family protein n=1 Tax=unclassified Calothrix TaxID=2619626 RepID=UPI0016847E79|nr:MULTISPECIES: DUF1822 family protein [unclassified Calothrix]MBD2203075.1 DUF1822 family protein [Calothrix sp. FACHB-168]MBD2218676.1 DUF1822 family protein [Calothrix sp. FACHB-1219]